MPNPPQQRRRAVASLAGLAWSLALAGCGGSNSTGGPAQPSPEVIQANQTSMDFMKTHVSKPVVEKNVSVDFMKKQMNKGGAR